MSRKYVQPISGASGRSIGKVVGDTFIKTVQGSRHFMRTPPAICIDEVAVAKLEELGVINIQVNDTDSGLRYRCSLAYFMGRGFKLDRGHGKQIGLVLTDWGISRDGKATAKESAGGQEPAKRVHQPELF